MGSGICYYLLFQTGHGPSPRIARVACVAKARPHNRVPIRLSPGNPFPPKRRRDPRLGSPASPLSTGSRMDTVCNLALWAAIDAGLSTLGACRVAACAAAGSWPLRRTQISRIDTRESHERDPEAGTKLLRGCSPKLLPERAPLFWCALLCRMLFHSSAKPNLAVARWSAVRAWCEPGVSLV